MRYRSTASSYGIVIRILHWLLAAAVLGAVLTALVAAHALSASPDAKPLRNLLHGVHKSLGLTIFTIGLTAILWRVFDRGPVPLTGLTVHEWRLARGVHIALYLSLIALGVSGYLMSAFGGHPVRFFSLYRLPNVVGLDPAYAALTKSVHIYTGYTLYALLAAHIVGMLKNQFYYRNDSLRRMVWPAKPPAGGSDLLKSA